MSKKEVVNGAGKANGRGFWKEFFLSTQLRYWIIGIAVVFVYGKTMQFNFVGLDDQVLITENYSYIKDLSNLPKAFLTHAFYNPSSQQGSNVYFRPMLTVSFMLDAQIGGSSPKFYHFTNILLHIISCLLLLKLLIRFKLNQDLAFVSALLFAVHPVLTQAVAWIPGRNDSLLAVFVFASFISLIQYVETNRIVYLFRNLLFFALSIFTKESAVAVLLLSLLCLFIFYPNNSEKSSRSKYIISLSAGYMLIFILWFLLRRHAMENTIADLSFASLSKSFVENLPLYLQFLQKSFLPFYLSILSVPADTNYILSIGIVMLIVFLLYRSKYVNVKKVFFGLFWFSAFLLPAFIVNILTGFEHRVYLPLVGILLILSEIDAIKNFTLNKSKYILTAAGIFILFLITAVGHTGTFSNNYSLWKTAVSNSKHSALARMNYGLALFNNGESEKAVEVYKEGLSINPNEPLIHNNLGIVYANRKMFAEAEAEFKNECKINPKFSDAYYNLGILYEQTGRDSLMVKQWEKAVEVSSQNSRAKNALAIYYNKKNKQN